MTSRLTAPLARLGAILPGGDFVKGSITIAAATGAAQVLVIATSPILTRLFDPAEFGMYSVALSLLSILLVVACLSYESAIPLPATEEEGASILALCVLVAIAVSAGLAFVLIVAGRTLLESAGAGALRDDGILLALGVLASGLVTALIGWAIRTKSYTEIAANRLTERVVMVVTQIGLGLAGWGATGLLVGVVLASSLALARLSFVVWRGYGALLRKVSRAAIVAAARRYRRFPLLSMPANLLNVIGLEAPLLLIVALFGASVGGQFALAHRVLALPLTLIARSIAQTYSAEAAQIVREDPDGLPMLYAKTTRGLILLTSVPIAVLAILSPLLFGIIFGADWEEAGWFALVLAPMYFLQLVTTPTHGTLAVLERQDLHLIREVTRLLLIGSAVLVAWALGLDPIGAVAVVSVAGVLTYSFYGYTTWRAVNAGVDALRRKVGPPADIDSIS